MTIYRDDWGKTSGTIRYPSKRDLTAEGKNHSTSGNDLYYTLRQDSFLKPKVFEKRMYVGKSFVEKVKWLDYEKGFFFDLNPAGPFGGAYGWGSLSDKE